MNRLLIAFFLTVFSFPFCCLHAESQDTSAVHKKITLGIIVPLSGPLSFFGQDYVRTFDLALEDHPDIKNAINVIWEDSAYDGKQAVAAFNKLVSVNKVDIVWSFGGPMLNVLAPLAEAKKIPFFATESEKKDCQGRKFCSLFRNEEDEWGVATWKVLREQGKKKIGIVKNQNQFMNTFVDAVIRNKNEDESVDILLDVPPETSDLRTKVLSLNLKDYDAVGVYLLPTSHHGFLSALRDLGKTAPLFGVEEFLVKDNNKGFESVIEGTLIIVPGSIESYRTKFEKRYGPSGGFYYTPAFYDFLTLLKDTLVRNDKLRGTELVDALHFSGERTGVSGKFSVKVSKDGVYSYSFPMFIYQIAGDKVVIEEVVNF